MRRLHSEFLLAGVTALALSACALAPRQDSGASSSTPAASSLPNEQDGATTGLRLAESRCSGCHAVTPGQVSPNSDAPPFASIAQRSGLTQSSAGSWLRESHNFPDQMNFYLDSDQAKQLAAYLWTLREAE
ncbi:MAG: cytochrome c [Hyphomonadaceae bacterium]|nr:cytochrome c [Hyphomonadaceae bacterium]